MVVWVLAGGAYGEAEFNRFLQKNFPGCSFVRQLPARMPPAPHYEYSNVPDRNYAGKTGSSFAKEMRHFLTRAFKLGNPCDAIVLLDDTDANDPRQHRESLENAAHEVLQSFGRSCLVLTALAIPEIESWLIADWPNTFQKDFGKCQAAIQFQLNRNGVNFENPETFLVAGQPYRKLSDTIIEAVKIACGTNFSKARDTPSLLMKANPNRIAERCAGFRGVYHGLKRICTIASVTPI